MAPFSNLSIALTPSITLTPSIFINSTPTGHDAGCRDCLRSNVTTSLRKSKTPSPMRRRTSDSSTVKDSNAALALVSARPEGIGGAQNSQTTKDEDNDPDLKRAKDLLELHANVKVANLEGMNSDLNDARQAIEKVLRRL